MNCTTDYAPPQITPTIRCCSQHMMVGVFFYLFSYSGLRAFFTSDFTNCTTDYAPPKLPQPSGAVHSTWWLGGFFDLFSYSGLRAFFTSDFTNCTTDYAAPQITPTIRYCSQHMMVGFFFVTSSLSGLEHFSQVILRIVLQIMPPPNYPNHQVLFTASDGWVFFLTSSPILDLEHFSQVILRIVLQIMPTPKITQTIRCCSQHLMVGAFFFDLFSYSGLSAFSQWFTNCTTDYAHPPK